jgi:hypothetical protein
MNKGIVSLLEVGKAIGELDDSLIREDFAGFLLSAVWGILSLSPSLSSSKAFISQSRYILKELENYKA